MKTQEAIQHLEQIYSHDVMSHFSFRNESTLQIRKNHLLDVLSFLKKGLDGQSGFEVLTDLTAVDYLEPEKLTKIIYWLQNPTNYERIRVIVFIQRDEKIASVTSLWAGANWYERELFDLFGIEFEGHPDLKRILMPDDWIGHPLRRDYKLTEESVEFKHGVCPKVPSEIIHVTRKQKLK